MSQPLDRLIADNLDIWTSATERKSGAGRGGGKRINLYGMDRLRALILDLATRGKLVPQDAGYEDAAQLVARSAKACRDKIARGAARKPKIIPPLSGVLPSLPHGWVWTQLGAIAEISPSNTADDDAEASFVPMALVSTQIAGKHEFEIRAWGDIKKGFTHFAEGDLGLAKITPCFENGKAAIFQGLKNGIGAGTTELYVARPWLDELDRRYLLLTMKTGSYLREGEARMTGTAGQKRVTRAYFEGAPIPLPPLAEQRRIVAKVDELMALCDALEQQSADAMAAHAHLVEELLATLVNSADAADLAANWARLQSHFDTLFTTESSIDALTETILDLAVRGKLAEQDARDGSASEFLASVDQKKRKLLLSGAFKKGKAVEPIDKSEVPFAIPANWEWRRLGDVSFLVTDGEHLTPKRVDDPNGIPLVTAKNVRAGTMDYSVTDFVSRETAEVCWQRCRPQENDILLVSVGATIGRHTIVSDYREMVIVRSVTLIKADDTIVPYLSCAISSQMMQKQIWGGVRQSAQPCLYLNVSNALQIPIPPLAEQHRIVAKVDALMALCDTLKARIAVAATTQKHLADAIVERAAA